MKKFGFDGIIIGEYANVYFRGTDFSEKER